MTVKRSMLARARVLRLINPKISFALTGQRSAAAKRKVVKRPAAPSFCSTCGVRIFDPKPLVSPCCAAEYSGTTLWWSSSAMPKEGYWRSSDGTLFRISCGIVSARKDSCLLRDLSWLPDARISGRDGQAITMSRTNGRTVYEGILIESWVIIWFGDDDRWLRCRPT